MHYGSPPPVFSSPHIGLTAHVILANADHCDVLSVFLQFIQLLSSIFVLFNRRIITSRQRSHGELVSLFFLYDLENDSEVDESVFLTTVGMNIIMTQNQ